MHSLIKSVFTDIDGTLLDHGDKDIPQSCVAALNTLKAHNVKIFPATGRSRLSAKNVLGDYIDGHNAPLTSCPGVFADGMVVYGENEDDIIYEHKMDLDKTQSLLDNISAHFPSIDWLIGTRKGARVVAPTPTTRAFCQEWMESHHIVTSIRQCEEESGSFPLYLLFIASAEVIDELTSYLESKYSEDFRIYHVCPGLLSVSRIGCSKWDGICRLSERYKLDLTLAVTIGDGRNDIEMLKCCANSIAMGNGCDEAKKSAQLVTTDITDDGWAKGVLSAVGLTVTDA